MSETKKTKSDDFPIYMFFIWLPIMMVLFLYSSSSDPNSLLTDEQKLEKQKEIELKKEQDATKWEDDKQGFKDSINWILVDRPFPFVHVIGLGILFLAMKGYNERHRYDHGLWAYATPSFVLPMGVAFIYLSWLSGYLNWRL